MSSTEPNKFTNYYECPCGHEWTDQWNCGCNDKCPVYNNEIEPFLSDDGSLTAGEIEVARMEQASERAHDMR